MLSPLQRTQLDNGIVLEGGLLCIAHLPLQITPAFQHNARHPLFRLPAEIREQVYSYLPLDHARIKLSAYPTNKQPTALRARPCTINSYGAANHNGARFDVAVQQTCRQLYADTVTRALRTSILFINSAENHASVALHMALYPARAWAVRSIEIPWNPMPKWWKTYDAPFFTRIFPALRRIYVYVVALDWTWHGQKVVAWDDPEGKAFLRTLRQVEGEGVQIGVMIRTRWEIPKVCVESWMQEKDTVPGELVRTRKKKVWTAAERDSHAWIMEARYFQCEARRRAAVVMSDSTSLGSAIIRDRSSASLD